VKATSPSPLRSLIVIAGFSIPCFTAVALPAAAGVLGPDVATVQFGDLDISRWQGATVLYNRIRNAAADICAPLGDTGFQDKLRTCVDETVDDAVIRLRNPELNSVYSAETGKPVVVASENLGAWGH